MAASSKSKAGRGKKRTAAVPISRRYCSWRTPPAPRFRKGVDPGRRRLIIQSADKWMNGVTIRYWFFDKPAKWVGSKADRDVVRRAFDKWKGLGLGLSFREVQNRAEADVRIAFQQDDGSWSYVGTDVRRKRSDPRTMNFGWSLTEDPQEGMDTALHEIGHTLGFPHEHQNPFAGIEWDDEAVYASLAGPPNFWSRSDTFHNILEKITPDEVQGSSWDPNSVMHYPFDPGLILKPPEYRTGLTPAGGLSPRDKSWAVKFYPSQDAASFRELKPLESVTLSLGPGDQADFSFTPTVDREYEFRTFGVSDTELALYRGSDATAEPIATDKDSGENRNATFKARLKAGTRYLLRVRLQYQDAQGETAVMAW